MGETRQARERETERETERERDRQRNIERQRERRDAHLITHCPSADRDREQLVHEALGRRKDGFVRERG